MTVDIEHSGQVLTICYICGREAWCWFIATLVHEGGKVDGHYRCVDRGPCDAMRGALVN